MKALGWIGWMITVIALASTPGCIDNTDMTKDSQVSECGGFEDHEGTYQDSDYCSAERLHWTYENGTLSLNNSRVLLNCCGIHDITIFEDFLGSYSITETDAPKNGSRCDCLCVYDFRVAAENIPESTISISLVRKVINDTTEENTVLQSKLDLSQSSGSIVVSSEDVSPWCE